MVYTDYRRFTIHRLQVKLLIAASWASLAEITVQEPLCLANRRESTPRHSRHVGR